LIENCAGWGTFEERKQALDREIARDYDFLVLRSSLLADIAYAEGRGVFRQKGHKVSLYVGVHTSYYCPGRRCKLLLSNLASILLYMRPQTAISGALMFEYTLRHHNTIQVPWEYVQARTLELQNEILKPHDPPRSVGAAKTESQSRVSVRQVGAVLSLLA